MLTKQTVGNNLYKMSGMDLTENNGTISISAGMVGKYNFDTMSFNLTPDTNLPVDYSLYLTLDNGVLSSVVDRKLIDGINPPVYDGNAIHRLAQLTLQADGTYTGTFTVIIAQEGGQKLP